MVATNPIPLTLAAGSLTNAVGAPDLGGAVGSFARLMGNLALVFAVLLGVVWVYRQWQRGLLQRTPSTGLRVIDAKNLGQRMALYVVAYRHQRFLVGGSPNGLSLLSCLDPEPAGPEPAGPEPAASDTESPDSPESSAVRLPSDGRTFRSALDKALDPSE